MTNMNYITVDEFKNFNPEIDFSSYSDVTISGMISRASKWVDGYLGYDLQIEDIENEKADAIVNSDGDIMIFPRKFPVHSVSKLEIVLGTYSIELDLQDNDGENNYVIPSNQRYIFYPYYAFETEGKMIKTTPFKMRLRKYFTRISYRAGYETIPDDIKDAVNLVAKDIFNRQTNPMLLNSTSQGGISMSFRGGEESDYVKQAKVILDRYKRVVPA